MADFEHFPTWPDGAILVRTVDVDPSSLGNCSSLRRWGRPTQVKQLKKCQTTVVSNTVGFLRNASHRGDPPNKRARLNPAVDLARPWFRTIENVPGGQETEWPSPTSMPPRPAKVSKWAIEIPVGRRTEPR